MLPITFMLSFSVIIKYLVSAGLNVIICVEVTLPVQIMPLLIIPYDLHTIYRRVHEDGAAGLINES